MSEARRSRWAVLLAAALLAACGTAPRPAPPSDTTPSDAMAGFPTDEPREGTWFGDQAARTAAQRNRETGAVAEAEAAESEGPSLPQPNGPQVAAIPESELPDPEDLMGLGAGELETLLGAPDFRRRDPPAELWQYAGPGCVLDTFLYVDGGGLHVKHVEARSRSVSRVEPRKCYHGILAERKKPEGG